MYFFYIFFYYYYVYIYFFKCIIIIVITFFSRDFLYMELNIIMNDLDLCKDKKYYEVFKRYKMMFYKIWDSLSYKLKFNVWPEEDDFFSFCYEKTVMAVNSIKPEKIKKPETWTIYIQLYRYVKTYANREIEKEYKNNACSLDGFIEENDYDENAVLAIYDQHEIDMDMFTPEEKEFIDYIQSGHKWSEKYTKNKYKELKKSITCKLL